MFLLYYFLMFPCGSTDFRTPPVLLGEAASCKWAEIAAIVAAAAALILGGIAVSHGCTGISAAGFSLGALLLAGEAVHRMRSCSRHAVAPSQSIYGYYDPVYSRRIPAAEKMAISLRWAVEAGRKDPAKNFVVDLEKAVSEEIDQELEDPAAGVAEAHNWKWRRSMEDVHFIQQVSIESGGATIEGKLVVVCDGHGDNGEVGMTLEKRLAQAIQEQLHALDEESVGNTFTKLMVDFDCELRRKGGTTLTAALILDHKIYIINVGDSRAILCKDSGVYQLSEDADPTNERFAAAIRKAGYEINEEGRVDGDLNVARDIGMEIVSPRPKITCILRGDQNDDLGQMKIYCPAGSYIVLACDGLWNWASIEEVYAAVAQMAKLEKPLDEMAARLVDGALSNGSTDNITVIVVKVE